MAEHTILHRTIAVKDFWGPGKHIYEDQLGWTVDEKKEAGAENGGYPPTQNGDIRSLFWLFSLMALQN